MSSADASRLPSPQRSMLRQMLAYMTVHPDAKDTVEGIRKWWRLAGRSVPTEEEMQEVLDFLAAREWLAERQVTPTQKIYGVNKERLGEITAFLQELEGRIEGHEG